MSNDKGLWLSVSDIAKAQGVTSQAIGKRVRALEAAGKVTTRKEGNKRMVNVAEFDFALAEGGDALKESSAATVKTIESSPGLREAQADKMKYDAELSKLKVQRQKGLVRDISEIEESATLVGALIIKQLEKLPRMAEEIVRAGGGKDVRAGKVKAKQIVDKIRSEMVQALVDFMAAESPADETQDQKLN